MPGRGNFRGLALWPRGDLQTGWGLDKASLYLAPGIDGCGRLPLHLACAQRCDNISKPLKCNKTAAYRAFPPCPPFPRLFRLGFGPTFSGLENSSHHIKIRPVTQAYSGYGNQARRQYPTGTDCGESEAAAPVQGAAAERRLHSNGVRGACPEKVFWHRPRTGDANHAQSAY